MEQRKSLIFKPIAIQDLENAFYYIVKAGLPETAMNYNSRMKSFAENLSKFPESFPICRFKRFTRYHFRCASFEGTYIFIYKNEPQAVVVYRVIHGKLLK